MLDCRFHLAIDIGLRRDRELPTGDRDEIPEVVYYLSIVATLKYWRP